MSLATSKAEAGATAVTVGAKVALSELKRNEMPDPAPEDAGDEAGPADQPVETVPLPDPIERFPLPDTPADTVETPQPEVPGEDDGTEAAADDQALPEILYDLDRLPEPVRRMHGLIMSACRSGDLEALRPLIGPGPKGTQLSFGAVEGDPIDFLRQASGDADGQEILAILLEVLDAGYVHLDAGTPNEIYVWPYFFSMPLDALTPPQRVELFELVTAGDYEDMKNFGGYNFYRVGITPEGRWVFFVAGD
ncbi:hypothetical protein [Nitratireductor alexandrii]|nr:hypothetical protein [Nitratireductor alexandrii]